LYVNRLLTLAPFSRFFGQQRLNHLFIHRKQMFDPFAIIVEPGPVQGAWRQRRADRVQIPQGHLLGETGALQRAQNHFK